MKSLGRIQINNNDKGYLIHGQPFSLNFEFYNAKWILVFYRPGAMPNNVHQARKATPGSSIFGNKLNLSSFFSTSKPNGTLNGISNAYFPEIHFYIFHSYVSLAPKKFKLALNINFMNAKSIDTENQYSNILINKSQIEILKKIKTTQNLQININQQQINIFGDTIPLNDQILNPPKTLQPIHSPT